MHINHFRTGVSKQIHFHPWRKWMTTTVILWNYTKLTIQSNPVHQWETSKTSEHRCQSLKQNHFKVPTVKTNLVLYWSGISWTVFHGLRCGLQMHRGCISDTFMPLVHVTVLCTQSFRPLQRSYDKKQHNFQLHFSFLIFCYINMSHRFTHRGSGLWTTSSTKILL